MNRHRQRSALWVMLALLGWSNCMCRVRAQSTVLTTSPIKQTGSLAAPLFIMLGSTRLHYVEAGTGKTVVLIHGNAGDLHDFEFGAIEMLIHDYHVVAIDLPGHGFSQVAKKSKGTIEEEATVLHDALKLIGVKDPILVGHSWGGAVALAYALRYPDETSGLVLLAPAAYPDHRAELQLEGLLEIPLLGDIALVLGKPFFARRILEQGLKDSFFPDPVPKAFLDAAKATWLGRKQIKQFIQNDRVLESGLKHQRGRYQTIQAPVVIVTGDLDRLVSPAQNALPLHQAIAKSELIVVPNAGHQLAATHPEVILNGVRRLQAGLETRIQVSPSRNLSTQPNK